MIFPATQEENKRLPQKNVVVPGVVITRDPQFMKGHGTYINEDGALVAAVQGTVERVNKLVSVRPLRTRYSGDVGDVVVGRIAEVGLKRWRVDIGARQDALLLLASIFLPGGIQRRKSESDELAMRNYFIENDLVVAEVQMFYNDGVIGLHTRSIKYGKLRNGVLATVPPSLIVRCKSHFHTLNCGVDVILGLNGSIWVSAAHTEEQSIENMYRSTNDEISPSQRENIARVYNCINALAKAQVPISDVTLMYAVDASSQFSAAELLNLSKMTQVAESAKFLFEMAED